MVRVFDAGVASPHLFWVQVKGVARLPSGTSPDVLSLRVDNDHAVSWSRMEQPVMLALFAQETGGVHWGFWHEADRRPARGRSSRSVVVSVPRSQLLDEQGLVRIAERVEAFYRRVADLTQVANMVAEHLRPHVPFLDVQRGIMLIRKHDGTTQLILFGPNLRPLERACSGRTVANEAEASALAAEVIDAHFSKVVSVVATNVTESIRSRTPRSGPDKLPKRRDQNQGEAH
jgi:hypothetical protein